MIIFSNMCYGMYYYVVKFQLKTPPVTRNTNYIRGVRIVWGEGKMA